MLLEIEPELVLNKNTWKRQNTTTLMQARSQDLEKGGAILKE